MKLAIKTVLGMVSVAALTTALAGQPAGFKGSVPYAGKQKDEKAMAALARISAEQAAAIARKTRPGTVVEVELEKENGYLVWEVEVVTPEGEVKLYIDAGDGKVLKAEREEEGEQD